MSTPFHRRKFLASLIGAPFLASAAASRFAAEATQPPTPSPGPHNSSNPNGLKTSLNAFSFNAPLMAGTMTLSDLLDFSATAGFEGVDLTGYYFKGYPQVPADEYLFELKRKAFGLGLGISGTGVRNDFTIADKTRRDEEVVLVKKWIGVAAKLGAPVIRIFAGSQKNEGIPQQQVTDWMLKDIQTCVDYGKQYGVVIGLQNHNDFIQTADQVIGIIDAIHSEWLGLILDTGSYRVLNPYEEISKSIKHTVNWQIKETLFLNGKETPTDLVKLLGLIKSAGYRGYLPIETLGDGDPKTKVTTLLAALQRAMA